MNKIIAAFLITIAVLEGAAVIVFFTTGNYAVFFLSAWLPTIAAVIALLVLRERAELKTLIRSYRFTIGFFRVLPLLLLSALLIGAALIVFIRIYGLKAPYKSQQLLLNIPFMLLTGALGEELGWRGVLLKQLLKKNSFILAALIMGIIWSLFHIPLWFEPNLGYAGNPFWLFTASLIGGSFIYTAVYIYSGGSLLACVLLHFIQNYMLALPMNVDTHPSNFFCIYTIINLILAVLIVLNWKRVSAEKERFLNTL